MVIFWLVYVITLPNSMIYLIEGNLCTGTASMAESWAVDTKKGSDFHHIRQKHQVQYKDN